MPKAAQPYSIQNRREPLISILRIPPKDFDNPIAKDVQATKRKRPLRFGETSTLNYSTFQENQQIDDEQIKHPFSTSNNNDHNSITNSSSKSRLRTRLRTRSTSHDQLIHSKSKSNTNLRRSKSEHAYIPNSSSNRSTLTNSKSKKLTYVTHTPSLRSQHIYTARNVKPDTEFDQLLHFFGNITKATWQVLKNIPQCVSHIPQFTMELLKLLLPGQRYPSYPAIQAR